jgi:hypothetical protein
MKRSSSGSGCDSGHLVTPGPARPPIHPRLHRPRLASLRVDLVVHRLVAAVERLEAFPRSGRIVPERNDETVREVIVRPYRIVYRLRPGLAEIVTVFRASRLFPEAT